MQDHSQPKSQQEEVEGGICPSLVGLDGGDQAWRNTAGSGLPGLGSLRCTTEYAPVRGRNYVGGTEISSKMSVHLPALLGTLLR